MPIYEYRCEQCGHEFEELVRGDEVPACPQCGKKKPHRKISAPASPRSASHGCSAQDAGMCPHDGGAGHCCGGNCGCHHHS